MFRFPRAIRLRRSNDFRRVQGKGRKHRTPHLVVLVLRGSGTGPRFGLVVSRKVGNAVTRNRVKRWLREAIRLQRHMLARQLDVVFIATPQAPTAGFACIFGEVGQVLSRVSA